jgi:hypothetical protein
MFCDLNLKMSQNMKNIRIEKAQDVVYRIISLNETEWFQNIIL